MGRISRWLIISLIVLAFVAVLGLVLLFRTRPADLAYDNGPDSVVIYADIRSYPGAPPPGQECLGKFSPQLRIWGDGLVFLDTSAYGKNPPWHWSGYLTPVQMQSVLKSLEGQGFFGDWTPTGPNPAATYLRVGAHLKAQSIEYMTGDLEPRLYTHLTDQIMSGLQPLTQQNANDVRLLGVLAGLKPCGENTSFG